MDSEWQSWTALAIVVVTAALYLRRLLRRRKSPGSCASDCSCDKSKPEPEPPGGKS